MKPFLSEDGLLNLIESKGYKPSELFFKALEQAKKSHISQLRDDGSSYLTQHIYPVAADLIENCSYDICPEIMVVSAILHDVLEDDDNISNEEFKNIFGEEIFNIVKSLTKDPLDKNASEEDKIKQNVFLLDRLKSATKIAKLIKLADRLNNLSTLSDSPYKNKVNRYIVESKKYFLPFAKDISEPYFLRLKAIIWSLENSSGIIV